ncbi:MAG: SGNH/GDSL hydrolase family protein [Gordonia paraffinivorans]
MGIVVAGVLALIVATVLVNSERRSDSRSAGAAAPGIVSEPRSLSLPRLRLPSRPEKLLVFGDSWTEGVAAAPTTKGFAYQVGRTLNVETVVAGVGGTGWVNPGPNGDGDYPRRMTRAASDPTVTLLLLQGGIYDVEKPAGVGDAVRQTIVNARSKFPNAQIVVIGPIPINPDSSGYARMSSNIGYEAGQAGAYFVSPVVQKWINDQTFPGFLDSSNNHPTTAGHTYIANMIVGSLRQFARDGQSVAQ